MAKVDVFNVLSRPVLADRSKITESPVAVADFPGKICTGCSRRTGGLVVAWALLRPSVYNVR